MSCYVKNPLIVHFVSVPLVYSKRTLGDCRLFDPVPGLPPSTPLSGGRPFHSRGRENGRRTLQDPPAPVSVRSNPGLNVSGLKFGVESGSSHRGVRLTNNHRSRGSKEGSVYPYDYRVRTSETRQHVDDRAPVPSHLRLRERDQFLIEYIQVCK